MRVPRIYIDTPLVSGEQKELPADISHYINRVLRLPVSAEVILFNGQGGEYSARILSVTKHSATLQIETFSDTDTNSPLSTHLGIGISRGERMDWVIQKATELGVTEITPLLNERTEVKLSGDRLTKRIQHWQKIAISACEQSGRTSLPYIHTPTSVNQWAMQCQTEWKWILHPGPAATKSTAHKPSSISILIGSEGGLTDNEIEQAKASGFESVSLGPRVLRTETAPITALSIIQFLWGDLGD